MKSMAKKQTFRKYYPLYSICSFCDESLVDGFGFNITSYLGGCSIVPVNI